MLLSWSLRFVKAQIAPAQCNALKLLVAQIHQVHFAIHRVYISRKYQIDGALQVKKNRAEMFHNVDKIRDM